MKKDVLIKLVSFAIALIIVAVLVLFKSESKNDGANVQVSEIFNDFSITISRVNNLLELFLSAEESSKMDELAITLSEQFQRAEQDYALLNSQRVESGLDMLLTLSGNYILKYAEDVKRGQISGEQKVKIQNLKTVVSKFSHELSKIEPEGSAQNLTEKIVQGYDKANKEASLNGESDASSSVSQDEFEEIPDNGNPLANAEIIGEEQAKEIAGEFFGAEDMTMERTQKGGIEIFSFKSDVGEALISVSGGFVVEFTRSVEGKIKNLSDEQCLSKAEEFLSAYHSANFMPRYFESDEHFCLIVFTTKNGATYCNPDKVEIIVSKQSGEITEFNALDFLKNYRNRTLQAPVHTVEQAKKQLGPEINVMQSWQTLAVTPRGENACYEFYCKKEENDEFLIRINAQTLETEDEILLPQNKNYAFLK